MGAHLGKGEAEVKYSRLPPPLPNHKCVAYGAFLTSL